MKLKWKFFIVLLVTSLVPMVTVTFFSHRASKELGESISAQTKQALTETVRRAIVSDTENYAMITGRAKSSLELALRLLISEAEKILARPPPKPVTIYFAEDFENPASAPEDVAPSSLHMKIMEDGKLTPKLISKSYPNFFVPPTVDRTEIRDDIIRFAGLSPALKAIAAEFGPTLFWIYASLESGVHLSFPGHGGYPDGYDPRLRPWYIQARNTEEGQVVWGPPMADATTKQLTFTVSGSFSKLDGSFAGVAAIDVLIPHVLLTSQISSQWSENMQSFLVGASEKGESFWILSYTNNRDGVEEGAGEAKTGMFQLEEEPDFLELTPLFTNQKVGNLEMPYHGVDSFWAYAEIFPGLYFVIVAPKSMILELPQKVGKSFSRYTRGQTAISLAAVLIIVLVVTGLALFISRANTKIVLSIVQGFKKLEQGDFSARIDVTFNDERDQIVTSFNRIMPRLDEHLRMSRALGVAHEVQQSLLPDKDPILQGFDIAGVSLYCDETGGDYYDFIHVSDDRLAVVVGDVSGHGVSSALLMATARALIMLRASMPGPAASIINDVNKHLSNDTYETGNFMTFFYCELNELSHEICWVRAGHDPALIYNPESDEFDELRGKGLALGLDYAFEYEEFQRSLDLNQIILIGTDGIWEMRNEQGEMFGKERLKAIIRDKSSVTAKEILAHIDDTLREFRGSTHLEDDVTMVVIKVMQ
ncbi:MAG: SpoIIE family protein phosphatase [Desulfobacterales bacterium]|nr:SpoIIE family protein phosphatase [Desulfobacterales bacterium]